MEQPYIPYQTTGSTPVKPQPIEHALTSIATQRSLLQTNHSSSPNSSSFSSSNPSILHSSNKYLEKDNYQIENKSKLSLPPEPERLRLKTPEKSLSSDKLCEKTARLRLSQEGLCDRNDQEALCLSSERLNNDDRKYQQNFINDQNRSNNINEENGIALKNDVNIKERSYRSQENLDSKFQPKGRNSPTFQEQKEKFLQEIKEKVNGLAEKHFKNSDKFQKSPVLKDIKDKKTAGSPRGRNVPNFLASKNIPENFSPGPQLVPERDLNSGPLRSCEVDFFSNSQLNLQNNPNFQKIEEIDTKHDDYFRSTGSLQELCSTKDENKFKPERDALKLNESKYGRLNGDSKPENRARNETHHSHNENNYENVDLQSSPRNSQNYENELREKVQKSKPADNKNYGVVKKDSSPELDTEESIILVPSDFENGNQKNLIVKPLSSNFRTPNNSTNNINNLRHSTRINGKSYPNIRNCGGNSPDKNAGITEGNFSNRQTEILERSPTSKDIGKLNGANIANKNVPQVNKQLKSINGGKVLPSRQGNGVPNNNSSSRGQRLPHRHVSVEELRLFQVSLIIFILK